MAQQLEARNKALQAELDALSGRYSDHIESEKVQMENHVSQLKELIN